MLTVGDSHPIECTIAPAPLSWPCPVAGVNQESSLGPVRFCLPATMDHLSPCSEVTVSGLGPSATPCGSTTGLP